MKKIYRSKKAPLIMCFLLLVCGALLYQYVVYDRQEEGLQYTAGDIAEYNGYDISGDAFTQSSDDPFFIIADSLPHAHRVLLKFQEPLQEELPCQIFFAKEGELYSEMNSVSGDMKQGSDTFEKKLPPGNYVNLRLDIDGDFSLDYVLVTTEILSLNPVRLGTGALLFVALLVLTWQKGQWVWDACLKKFYDKTAGKIKNKIASRSEQKKEEGPVRKWIGGVYDRGHRAGLRMEKCFVAIAAVTGIIFSVAIPPGNIPDEKAHYELMMAELGLPQVYDELDQYFQDIQFEKVLKERDIALGKQLLQQHRSDRFSYGDLHFHGASVSVVRHLPACIGFFAGFLLHLPICVCMELAEVGSLVFFLCAGYGTLKRLPVKKELMCIIMLLPMTVQQCASVNYDAVIMPVSFWLTAYIAEIIYRRRNIGWKETAVFAACAVIIAVAKPPYLLIFLLLLLVPAGKWSLPVKGLGNLAGLVRKHKAAAIILGIILAGAAGYLARNSIYVKLLVSCLFDIRQFGRILSNTLWSYGIYYWGGMIANFGWLDSTPSLWVYGVVSLALLLFAQSDDREADWLADGEGSGMQQMGIRERVLCLLIFIMTSLLIIVVLFTHSYVLAEYDLSAGIGAYVGYLRNINASLGVQGRYFIPVVFFLLAAFSNILKLDKKLLMPVQVIYYPLIYIECIAVLVQRYWIV